MNQVTSRAKHFQTKKPHDIETDPLEGPGKLQAVTLQQEVPDFDWLTRSTCGTKWGFTAGVFLLHKLYVAQGGFNQKLENPHFTNSERMVTWLSFVIELHGKRPGIFFHHAGW